MTQQQIASRWTDHWRNRRLFRLFATMVSHMFILRVCWLGYYYCLFLRHYIFGAMRCDAMRCDTTMTQRRLAGVITINDDDNDNTYCYNNHRSIWYWTMRLNTHPIQRIHTKWSKRCCTRKYYSMGIKSRPWYREDRDPRPTPFPERPPLTNNNNINSKKKHNQSIIQSTLLLVRSVLVFVFEDPIALSWKCCSQSVTVPTIL